MTLKQVKGDLPPWLRVSSTGRSGSVQDRIWQTSSAMGHSGLVNYCAHFFIYKMGIRVLRGDNQIIIFEVICHTNKMRQCLSRVYAVLAMD